jgi:3-methylfumaryl-CoA hydratase
LIDWIGNREETTDLITTWPARALQATLGFDDAPLDDGDALPPLWHWLYFLPTVHRSGLGEEGHARRGGFLPPVPLPRRMFAGGRVEFLAPLRIGRGATRVGTVTAVEEKQGRTGPLVFVTVRYEVSTDAGPVLREEQDLVYRGAPTGRETPSPGEESPPAAAWSASVEPDEVLLFRFSALTFNSHRIHYDHPYVTDVEGYPGLIVHGPLIALLLADLARREGRRPLSRFAFRARSPLFADGRFGLLGDPVDGTGARLSAWSHDWRPAMTAEAEYAE